MDPKSKLPYNKSFVPQKDLRYLPSYMRDVPETRKEVKCKTEGTWPSWLQGTFIRIGAGKFIIPVSLDGSKPAAVLNHLFDGLSILHKFKIANGEVHYASRHTSEGVVRRAAIDGFVTTTMFGPNANTALKDAVDPCSIVFAGQNSLYLPEHHLPPDGANVGVTPHRAMHLPPDKNPLSKGNQSVKPEDEEIMVMTDFNMIQICDSKSLEPKRLLTYADIDPALAGWGICAHPPKDRDRGLIFNYLVSKEGQLNIFALNYKSNPARLMWKTLLPCEPCYIHSLAMSRDYVIFIRNPITMNVSDMTRPFMEMLEYSPDVATDFYVLDKLNGQHIATYAAPNIMFLHAVNAYDFTDVAGEKCIHIDLCCYQGDHHVYQEYTFDNLLNPVQPFMDATLVRYELRDVTRAEVATLERVTVVQAIAGTPVELPRISKSVSMKEGYRFVYGTGGNGGPSPGTQIPIGRLGNGLKVVQSSFIRNIVKADWLTGRFIAWQPPNGESSSCEPIFVERPGAVEDDDGVVLTIVCNRTGSYSVLVALDAKDFTEVARADMPQVYTFGPHGTFVEGTGMFSQ